MSVAWLLFWTSLPWGWNAVRTNQSRGSQLTWRYEANATEALLRQSQWSMLLYEWSVPAAVQSAITAWQMNSDVQFRQVASEGASDVVIDVAALPPTVMATTTRTPAHARVTLSASQCWFYHDASVCRAVRAHKVVLLISVGLVAGCFLGVGLLRDAVRALAASCLFAEALFFGAYIAPCIFCQSIFTAVTHEFGHVLSLAHADAGIVSNCGCGRSAHTCLTKTSAVMDSHSSPYECLQKDDVDAIRSMHGGDCAVPIVCSPPPRMLSAHLGTVACCSFALHALLAALRGRLKRFTADKESFG